ncbi:MAG: hypothetical protein JWM34_369 [Ilumatobacteraceae bacterium]|nr:hypothetical protein [Ilumatobacteraceae bacterium]
MADIDCGHEGLGHDADERAALAEARRRVTAKAVLRTKLLDDGRDVVTVHARVHLLPPRIELELRDEVAAVEDRLAVLRHCDPDVDPRCVDMHEHARLLRRRLHEQLDAFICTLEVRVGQRPTQGPDWSAAHLASGVLADADDRFANLRRDVVAEIDRIVDSELLRVLTPGESPAIDGVVDCGLVDFDADSVERVRAFIATMHQLAARAEQAVLDVRFRALTTEMPDPRLVLAQNDARRRQALQDLDMARALQAAVEEVQRAHLAAPLNELADPRA